MMTNEAVIKHPYRQPLPPGTEIQFCEERGIVVDDPGGDDANLTVDVGDCITRRRWTFEGATCTVVSLPQAAG